MHHLFIANHKDIETNVKVHMYRKIFNEEFNYSFHRPKKDGCKTCEQYKNTSNKENLKTAYDEHIKNKELARVQKEKDKEQALCSADFKSFTFDLQSVLYTPCSNISSFYYSRKFASFNHTIFDQATKKGFCYIWNETDAGRGSDEIGTCLLMHLKKIDSQIVKRVSFFSDSCGGQNRNRFIAIMLIHCIRSLQFEQIELKFLETGHTQMEVDCMHSTIEAATKHRAIFCPNEWPTILRMAKIRNPYDVDKINYSDIIDLKELLNNISCNDLKKNTSGEVIEWMKIKWLKVVNNWSHLILYKTDWEQEEFDFIDLTANFARRIKVVQSNYEVKQKYSEPLGISKMKKNDLIKLCENNLIPSYFHKFYNDLKLNSSIREKLPEPDINENDGNEQ